MSRLEKAFGGLRTFALSLPETREDHPWGETAIKVRGKTFLFMRHEKGKLGLSVKLDGRHEFALEYPFASPTRYGLGKSGWVTATFLGSQTPPMDVLRAWVDESYRTIAPEKLVALLGETRQRGRS